MRAVFLYVKANHLGNVLAVVSDARQTLNSGSVVTGYQAIVVSANDYSVFGGQMPGRQYNSSSSVNGFNGKRKDDEITGSSGTDYDFGDRIYDARLGRWLSVDEKFKKYPGYSPYNFAVNSPTNIIDVDGKDIYLLTTAPWVEKDSEGNITAKHPGHTMIAVDNYDKVVNDVLDEAGNVVGHTETYVANGTVSVYDLNTPNNVGKLSYMTDQTGVVNMVTVDKKSLINKGEITSDKPNQFDGVTQITTDHSIDEKERAKLEQKKADVNSGKVKFNGISNNCSTFAVDIINDIPGYEDVTGVDDIQPTGTPLHADSVTPNKLAQEVKDKTLGDKGCGKVHRFSTKLSLDWIDGYTGGKKKDETPGK